MAEEDTLLPKENAEFYEDELTLVVSTKRLARQLQVSSVKKLPKQLIAGYAPELLFKIEESAQFKNALNQKFKRTDIAFSEIHVLGALDLETPNIRAEPPPMKSRKFTEVSIEEIKQQAEEKLGLDKEAGLRKQAEDTMNSLVSFQGFFLSKSAFQESIREQQEAYLCLMRAVSIHTDLHRVSAAHRIRLKVLPHGGPLNDDDGEFNQGKNVIRSGQRCFYGVAPIVGVTINHPFVHQTTSRTIESVSIVTLWGTAGSLYERLRTGRRISNGVASRWISGVAACLTVLHKKGFSLSRLSSHGVTLFPRTRLVKGGDDNRLLTPDAKVWDLSRIIPVDGLCPWSMKELVCDDVYLPPHILSSDERGEATQENDLWFLGCLALELILKAPLATCNFGRVSQLTVRELDGLIPGRFSDELRQLVTSLLLHDGSKRPKANQVLETLAPKEAARLRGDDLRGWSKRFPKKIPHNAFDDEDDDDMDTDSGSDSSSGSEAEDGDLEESESETENGDHSSRRYRFGVKEAVNRANKRVVAYNRAAWWAALSEEKRVNILHRRKTRRMAKARIAFLRFCQGLALFKEWTKRVAAEWYQRVVTMGVLAGHLEPFTESHKDALFDFDDDDDDDDDEHDDDEEEEAEEEEVKDGDNNNQENANPTSDNKHSDRLEGPIGEKEDLTSMLRQLCSVGSYYDLTPNAARCGLTPSLRPCRTGAAGELGGNEASDLEEYKLALRKSKLEQQALLSGVPLPVELPPPTVPEPRQAPPKVPPPHQYETSSYRSGAEIASLEWKANGYIYWAGLEEAFQEADLDFKALMKTAFAYEEPAVHAERLLHFRVNRVREQEALKPIIERTVSAAEPSTPTEAQINRASCMISLCLVQAFIDTRVWFEVGRHWASSKMAALTRGWLTRTLIRQVWQDAAALARQQIIEAEDKAIEIQDKWRRNMASREAYVRGANNLDVVFAPTILTRASRSFSLGLPSILSRVSKRLRQLKLQFTLTAAMDPSSALLYGTDCVGVITVNISVAPLIEDDEEVGSTPKQPTCLMNGLSPASSYLVCFSIIGEKVCEALGAEDPSWVDGDPVLKEERTLDDAPDCVVSLTVNIALLEDNTTLPCVLTSKFIPDSRHNRSIAHLTWQPPMKVNGSPIDSYRVQRRFILLFKSPLDDISETRVVTSRWQRVFEGMQCGWTDMMEDSEKQVDELNQLACDPDQSKKTNKYDIEPDFDYGLPDGFSLRVEFKVAAHNGSGWGKPCRPSSSALRVMKGLVVAVPEEWVAFYEKVPASNVVPLPLLQPQQLTDGIFHNFLQGADTSGRAKHHEPTPQMQVRHSQTCDVGIRTWLIDSKVKKKETKTHQELPNLNTQELVLGRVQDEDMTSGLLEKGIDPKGRIQPTPTRREKKSSNQVFIRPSCKMKKKTSP